MELEAFKSNYGYYNFRMNGGKPTEEMVNYLKENGYRWSRNKNCWYPATSEAKEKNLHEDFVADFQKRFFDPGMQEQKSFSINIDEQGVENIAKFSAESAVTNEKNRIAYLEELLEQFREEHKKDQEKIAKLEAIIQNQNSVRIINEKSQFESEVKSNKVQHENGYVLTKAGSKDFGEINPEIASEIHHESGKIRLETGFHNENGQGFGEVHIERSEGLKQLKENGFDNARDFIEYVSDNYDAIYEGRNNTLIIVKKDEKSNIAYLSLKQNKVDKEIFYTVESGLISRQNYLKENKLLWTNPNSSYEKEQERAQSNHLNETPSAISGNSFDDPNLSQKNDSVNESMTAEQMFNALHKIAEKEAREDEPKAENAILHEAKKESDEDLMLSPEEMELAKSVLPTTQYVSTLRYAQGEEREFFIKTLKGIANSVKNAPKIGGTDRIEQHPIVLRYFHPTGTETLVTEIGKDGEAYGFQCLNGDYEMAEWGYIDLNEVKNIRGMEADYHVEEGMTVERWLYKEEPDMFPQYAKYAESTEKTPFDVAQDTGNDIEAIAGALNENKPLFAELTEEEKSKIFFGLWEAEDKGLMEYHEEHFPGDRYPAYPGDAFVEEYLLKHLSQYDFAQLKETFLEEEKSEKNEFVPKPVGLESILAVMDMRPEMTTDGKILVFDEQRKEYIDNGEDFEGNGQKAWEFSSAAEIFERLDIFIKEAFIDDMEDQLNAVGIKYTEDGHARSLEECCELYKKEIENGNTQLSEGELNLAFGIVNPETVILPEQNRLMSVENQKTEQTPARDELLSHVKYFVTEFAEFPSYDDTESMSLEDAVKLVRERKQQEHNYTNFGTNALFTVGIEIDGEKFGNDGASYNPETGNFETLMFEANSLFRKYGAVALEELADEIQRQNNGLPPAMRLPCNFNPADFGLEENEEVLVEAENGQMMTPDELRRWNEEQEMQHGHDSEFDELKEGKNFALEAAKEKESEQAMAETVTPEEVQQEKSLINKKIEQLKGELNELENTKGINQDELDESIQKKLIQKYESFTDDDIKQQILWKKENQRKNEENHKAIVELMKEEREWQSQPQEGELLSYDETHPTYTLTNKETKRQISIQPTGNLAKNVKELGRLGSLTEANEVIGKIRDLGFDIYSTGNRVVIFNDDKFYDFDAYADSGKFNYATERFEHNLDKRNLKDWDFKDFISGGLKITKAMKEFEKIEGIEQPGKEEDRLMSVDSVEVKVPAEEIESSWQLSQNKQDTESPKVYRICIQNRYDNHPEIERKVLNTVNSHDFPENFKKLFKSLPDEVNGEPAYFGNFFSAKPDFSSGYSRYSNGRGWHYLLPFEVKDNKVEFAKSEKSPTDFSWDEKIANKLVGEKFEIEDCYIEYDFSNKNIYGQKGFHTTNVEEFISKIKNAQKTQADIAKSNSIWQQQPVSKKDIKAIREQCRKILKKPDSEITESDKAILAQYEGAGGLNEDNRTNNGILNEFYTPNNLVEKVWEIVDAYAPDAKTVLEPSAGVGKFANNRPNNEFTMHEFDETSARINKILHPEANIIQGAYQKQFFDDGERFRRTDFVQPKYDVVIGNPPYGAYNDKYRGLGEGKEFDRYEEYFISKGLDALKDENSIMAFVVPSGFLNTASDKQKEIIASKGRLIDAYRLPVGTFPTTEVGTDIIIMQNWDKIDRINANRLGGDKNIESRKEVNLESLSNGEWFKNHPENILGEVKTRTNRFGKEEEFVAVHEGLTVQDELNKISAMIPKLEQTVSIETTASLTQSTMDYIKKVTDSWDNNNWQVISPNSGEVDAANFFNQYFTDFVGSEMENNPQLREEREAAVKNISDVAKQQEKTFYDLVDETIKSYLEEKHGYKIWDYAEIKKPNEENRKFSETLSAYETVYPEEPEKAKELAQKISNAIETRNHQELMSCMFWGRDKDCEVARGIFEKTTGEKFPEITDFETKYKAQLWLSKRADEKTVPETYKFTSREDYIKYIAQMGSGTEGGKDRIEKFFAENNSNQERAKFLSHECGDGWYGSGTGIFDYSFTPQQIKAEGFIAFGSGSLNFEGDDIFERHETTISYTELAKEIDRQIKLGIYNKKEEQGVSNDVVSQKQSQSVVHGSSNEPLTTEPTSTSDGQKAKTSRPKKEKWNITKSKGEVMTAEEFSRLYGKDFDEREFPIWKATDWQGNIDLNKLSDTDIIYMEESGSYVQKDIGEWTHKVLFMSGDIYKKLDEQKRLFELAKDSDVAPIFENNIALLESVRKEPLDMSKIHFGLKTNLAEEFLIDHVDADGNPVQLNLQESFILWAQNSTLAEGRWRGDIDFATANISREELGEELSFRDIIAYIDGDPVKADKTTWWDKRNLDEEGVASLKAERKKEADLKRQARSDTANRLFDRYLHEGLTEYQKSKLAAEYNRKFNSYIIPDYSKLPLFVEGMSAYKGSSKFKLYDQQIKGISFLCNKGNGLLAYDVGVGKTAAGIVATVNQIQTARSKRPLIVVPNQVYSKWYTDIRQLFPNIPVNDLYNFNKDSVSKLVDSENPHKLNIPANSISICTYEALKNITFTDQSCENELYQDFANLLSADFDGSDRENAESSDKIKGIIGSASHVKDANYYFFEDCGFDNLTVDEAHNFKNLWVVPKPKKKGQSNEYAGIPSGKPSARALKMYGMTQLVQRNNDDRNVFMLTATPFTNSPTEVYSMLSYIGRERLREAGISSLRSFFDEFAQTKQELGVTSTGNVDTKQVMKSWKELPALQSILTEFIDKVDGEEAGIIRPNKFTHVKPLDMSELQKQMREVDEERMAEIKEGNSAAIIVAMNNMRLSCVAPALANPAMYPDLDLPPLEKLVETSPKLKFVCDAIIDMYKDNPEKGQFMYVPLGKDSHGIIKDYLVKHGIPKEAVEIINGEINNTPEKKEKITAKFNDEKNPCKIIIGGRNTAEGIDLNGNSFVMYNCSLGWNPSETIQAEGRIWRQGNLQGNVHVVYPVMNDSIDSVLYQKHDEKRSRINELWNYKGDSLNVEDINPEDLKLDLIKDPQKKAKLILNEETKEVRAELSKINLKIRSFDEIIEKRKQFTLDFDGGKEQIAHYEGMIEDYKSRGLEVPEWIKISLKDEKRKFLKAESGRGAVEEKLAALNLVTDDDIMNYIRDLNNQKHTCEDKIKNIEKDLPQIMERLKIEQMEQKLMEYPVEKQREILESDILNNLRPMKEVEYEIKTMRFEAMLAEKLKASDIAQEEHDLYKAAGYDKYEKWQNGEIESLEEQPNESVIENPDRHVSVEHKKPDSDVKQAVEAIPGENDSLKSEYQDITSIVVNYDGHWGEERNEKQGWRYEKKEFNNPKEALEFLKTAKVPREVTLVTETGFKSSPLDDEKYLNEMIESGFEIKPKKSNAKENDPYGGLDLFTSMGISDEEMFVHSPETDYEKSEMTFAQQVDAVLAGTYDRFNALKVSDTPQILLDVGCKQLPILYTQKHLKDAVHEKSAENPHWHGLTVEQVKEIPELLANPAILMDSPNNDGSLVAVLAKRDNDNAPLFATIKPNGFGTYEYELVDSNFMLSVYGKETGFEQYIKNAIADNKILYWNKEKSQEIQCAELLMVQGLDILDSDKILHQTNSLVNPNVVHSPEKPYFNAGNDDIYLTPEQLTKAEIKRDEIILPILSGKESGMYKAFNDFAKHGVFDVIGTKIDLADKGKISTQGWKQLHAAMNIYRSKEFETMRYVLIDKVSGEIRDQLAVFSCMPNQCSFAGENPRETLQNLIARAEETNSLIVAVHNHPSGNVTESKQDIKITDQLEKSFENQLTHENLFAGHIILDHDTFNLYTKENGWQMKMDWENVNSEDKLVNKDFALKDLRTDSSFMLKKVAEKINDTENWNDDFIPIVFSNPGNEVTGIKFYDKSFFNKTPHEIRNELQFVGIEAGAEKAFPVFTEHLANKMTAVESLLLEEKLKNLVLHNAFTDAALPQSTVVEKYDIKPGIPFYSEHDKKNPAEIQSTWQTRINPTLFEQMQMGTLKIMQIDKKPFREQEKPRFKKAVGMGY